MYIKHVTIKGFWGMHTISTELFQDVNVFVGKNGTGKTTFMNILQSVLEVDLKVLISYEFDSVKISLTDGKKSKTINVERRSELELPYEDITYRIGTRKFPLRIHQGDFNVRLGIRHSRFIEQIKELRNEMNTLVSVSSLSVHRMPQVASQDEELFRTKDQFRSLIDVRLSMLMQKLTGLQLSLALKAREVSTKFEKEVLASMLYNKEFDRWDLGEVRSIKLGKEKTELVKAYKELKAFDSDIKKLIDEHFKAIENSIKSIQRSENEKAGYDIDAIIPLPLVRRTQHIVALTTAAEKKKQEIFQPISRYLNTLSEFIFDKEFQFGADGEFQAFKFGKQIALEQLSSGEKQLLILLTETLLQMDAPFVFLADEPEISLHIEWQARIISSIKTLNEKAQVIVATHSPEIAGGWKRRIIDMEDIIGG